MQKYLLVPSEVFNSANTGIVRTNKSRVVFEKQVAVSAVEPLFNMEMDFSTFGGADDVCNFLATECETFDLRCSEEEVVSVGKSNITFLVRGIGK